MQLGFDVQIPDGLLAANALLAENSRQGFATGNRAPYQGLNRANCTAALGLSWSVASGTCSTHVMGRWMSPDRVNVTEDRMMNPSSTLNKYAYGANNPLKYTDPDGEDITIFYEPGNPVPGHTMLLAYNQQSGDSAIRSFGPDHTQASTLATAVGLPVPGTDSFGFENIKSADDLRANFASITIQTTPEEAQAVINAIRTHPDGNYTTYFNNCTTTCSKLLRSIGKTHSHAVTPMAFFNEVYGEQTGLGTGRSPRSFVTGRDYGNPRSGFDAFSFFFRDIPKSDPEKGTQRNTAPPCLKSRDTGGCV